MTLQQHNLSIKQREFLFLFISKQDRSSADYMREFMRFKTRISEAPISCNSSILTEASFFNTKLDTAFDWLSSRDVTVGERFPGVMLMACSSNSFETLYIIITYLVAVM
jgi:hypothetical protein